MMARGACASTSTSTMAMERRCKIALIGVGGVGKTSLGESLKGKPLPPHHYATLGCETFPLEVNTNNGVFCLDVWDLGSGPHAGLGVEGYTIGAQIVVGVYNDARSANYLLDKMANVPQHVIRIGVFNKFNDDLDDETKNLVVNQWCRGQEGLHCEISKVENELDISQFRNLLRL